MTDQDIANMIMTHFKGGTFVEARVITGRPISFALVFENKEEQRGQITFQPVLGIESSGGELVVTPRQNISIDPFKK